MPHATSNAQDTSKRKSHVHTEQTITKERNKKDPKAKLRDLRSSQRFDYDFSFTGCEVTPPTT